MSFRKRRHFCWRTSPSFGIPLNNTTHFCTANHTIGDFSRKVEGHTHPLTCRQFVAGRGAGRALELALTFVCLDDLRRGSRHTEQLLAEMIGRTNDMNVLWIHRVGASRVVVTAYLDGGCTCLGLARTKTAQQEGGRD